MKKFISALMAVLACIAMCFLVACTPSNVEDAETKMEEAGYTVIAYSNKDAEGLVGGLVATKAGGLLELDVLTAAYFETADDAKAFYENLDETGAVQDGKWVYWGDEDAVEDFTK